MADPFIGEIRIFAGNYAPQDWALCDGRSLNIQGNEALYAVIGNIYGGDAKTFKLPDLRGRVPVSMGAGAGLTPRTVGQSGGAEGVTLTAAQMPAHNHSATSSSASATFKQPASTAVGTLATPANNYIAAPASAGKALNAFSATSDTQMAGSSVSINVNTTISNTGGGQPHMNMQPFLCVNFIIALSGLFPPRQ